MERAAAQDPAGGFERGMELAEEGEVVNIYICSIYRYTC